VVDGALRVRVTAPPVEGAANHALINILARELAVPRTSIRLVAGATVPRKLIVVEGISQEAVLARWPGLRV
jgi:uncharacterized protein